MEMRMNEIANAQDQLDLLRLIIDNTWNAIRQQANAQAKQQVNKASTPKAHRPTKAAYTATPKPLPKPRLNQAQLAIQQQGNQAQLVNQIHNRLVKSKSLNPTQQSTALQQQMGPL